VEEVRERRRRLLVEAGGTLELLWRLIDSEQQKHPQTLVDRRARKSAGVS
jgi:hypothetical protein